MSFDREPRTLYVESTATGDFQVARSSFEPRSGRFDVTLTLPGSAITRGYNLRYHRHHHGDGRSAGADPRFQSGRGDHGRQIFRSNAGRKAKSRLTRLWGQEAVAGLAAAPIAPCGSAAAASDLVRPEIVKRDENVTIIYEVPGILLTLRGKAVEGGALGDTIRSSIRKQNASCRPS